jgi:carboxyl-terminal processing protease
MWLAQMWPDPQRAERSEKLQSVHETYRLIRRQYLGEVTDRQLQQGAIEGMISVLDGVSSYVPPGQLDTFSDHMRGVIHGFGLKLEPADDGEVVVVAPLFGSPAQDAGILPGDRIVAVDDQDVATMTFDELQASLAHPTRDQVELSLVRAHRPLTPIRLRRRQFKIETVTGLSRGADQQWIHLIDPDHAFVYVRISEFVTETAEEFQQIFRGLSAAEAIVLDLRDNPGGLLPAAVQIADLMLTDGPIVTVWSPRDEARHYRARSTGTTVTVPVVVLVDVNTASAAEIVAGALQANARAVLIGQPTRGKASVQTMYPLAGAMGQINITTCRYALGEDAEEPAARAVTPDVTVVVSAAQREELSRLRWVSALGPAALSMPDQPTTAETQGDAPEPDLARQIAMDPQLSAAVELLRTPGAIENLLQQRAQTQAEERRHEPTNADSGH